MATLVFGGAFDPPHSEHIRLCACAAKQLNLDRLVVVPTYCPPHKNAAHLPFEQRVELCRIAFDDVCKEVIVDELERTTNDRNYASDNVLKLKGKYGDLIYLIGGDSMERFAYWHEPEKIAAACVIATAAREGYDDVTKLVQIAKEKFGGEYRVLDFVGKDVSSSVLKAKLLLGLDTPELPENEREYIEKNSLFHEYRDKVAQLKSYQSDELFNHSMNVVLKAVDINSKAGLNLDFDQVFTAALLHDNAKERKSIDGLNVPSDALNSPVLHQFLGAEKARRDFGVTDQTVLDGIRYHTSAKADMTTFEKLIYTADSVSDDRDYEPIPALRAIVEEDFERGFLAVLKRTYLFVIQRNRPMYPLTQDAYDFYKADLDKVPTIL